MRMQSHWLELRVAIPLEVPTQPIRGTCLAPVKVRIDYPWLHSQERNGHWGRKILALLLYY